MPHRWSSYCFIELYFSYLKKSVSFFIVSKRKCIKKCEFIKKDYSKRRSLKKLYLFTLFYCLLCACLCGSRKNYEIIFLLYFLFITIMNSSDIALIYQIMFDSLCISKRQVNITLFFIICALIFLHTYIVTYVEFFLYKFIVLHCQQQLDRFAQRQN